MVFKIFKTIFYSEIIAFFELKYFLNFFFFCKSIYFSRRGISEISFTLFGTSCHSRPCLEPTGSSDGKESACSAADQDLIPGSGRSPGEGNGNPLQYSCLENSMDRGDWQVAVYEVAESDMTE